ncbi:MAG: hypothetical protein JSV86_01590 [Gemmatimonadota bacterium]|nr:MAG: hypothetical protein JSV86_01590 [Gemmatimonadota bacterium]
MGDPATGMTGKVVDSVVHTSVATFYSNLVTRPTGRAVRSAIEEQLQGGRGRCVSVLDFSQVGVLDFSCADEVIAKLLRRYLRSDRPSDAFFIVQGVLEHHRDPIDAVLRRHNLLLVAVESGRPALWGPAPGRLRAAWDCLDRMGRLGASEFASTYGVNQATASSWLRRLVNWRVAVPESFDSFSSLPAVLSRRDGGEAPEAGRYPAAAEEMAPYGPEPSGGDGHPRPSGDTDPYPSAPGGSKPLPAY